MTDNDASSSPQLQHFTQNEARALRSMYNYYRSDDDDASISVICLAIINDLGRNHHERSCMKRAMEEFYKKSSSEPSKSKSFLCILDHGKELFLAEVHNGNPEGDDYHFLRVLNEYQDRCNVEGKYLIAKQFMEHERCLRKEEESRQIEAVKRKHNHDRNKIVAAHDKQMEEFKETWLEFLDDFERKSQEHVKELEEAHEQQLSSMRQSLAESSSKPKKWSRDLIQYRERQLLMADQQRYQEAHKTKQVSDALEEKERSNMNSGTNSLLEKRERNLRKQHLAELGVLMKRIESKMKEYAKQKDEDIYKVQQRNRFIQATFDSKHATECLNLASKIEQNVKNLMKENDTC